PVFGSNPWALNLGFASDAPALPTGGAGTSSNGWLPLYLPEGSVIQQLVVNGAKTASPNGFIGFVSILVQPIGDSATTTLILIDLSTGGNPFTLTGVPNVPGAGPAAIKDLQTVKNSVNKYMVRGFTTSSTAGTILINTLRVV